MKVYPTVVLFDDFVFPRANSPLNWKLRYAQDQITKEDLLGAASIISAYDSLIYSTQKKRNGVCEILKVYPMDDTND